MGNEYFGNSYPRLSINMKCLLSLLLVLLLQPVTAISATIITDLFSLEVPDEWVVEGDKAGLVTAGEAKLVGSMPSPFLSVQYCFSNELPKDSIHYRCNTPCSSESAKKLTSSERLQEAQFSVVKKVRKDDGTTQYTTELVSPVPVAMHTSLSCSARGQIVISLVSDLPRDSARMQFGEILKSLKWK